MTETLAPTDPRFTFAKAVSTARAVVDAVQPAQLANPTPCPGLDVRAMLGHMVEVLERVAVIGTGGDPFTAAAPVVADNGWPAAVLDAAHRVQRSWTDDATLEKEVHLPWADMSGADALRTYTSELTTHTWDLAKGVGGEPAWEDDVLRVALDSIRHALPAEGRIEEFEKARAAMPEEFRDWQPPFANARPVAEDAPLIDQLAAWTGRDPRWTGGG